MKIFISKDFYLKKDKKGYGLISGQISLRKSGYNLFSDAAKQLSPEMKFILASENIKLNYADKKDLFDYTVISSKSNVTLVSVEGEKKYSTFYEAVESLIKRDRIANIKRKTRETDISVSINLDGKGISKIKSGIGFFDHMLDQISRHGNVDLQLITKGDLHVDEHHTIEDTGIALGEAIQNALGNKMGIKRYGFYLPMDDSEAECRIDLGGRNYLNFNCKFKREKVGEFPTELVKEFFKGVAMGLSANILIRAKGENDHHKIEAMFKAFAKALNEACRFDERANGMLPTTKGLL